MAYDVTEHPVEKDFSDFELQPGPEKWARAFTRRGPENKTIQAKCVQRGQIQIMSGNYNRSSCLQ